VNATASSTVIGVSVTDNGEYGIRLPNGAQNNVVNCSGKDNGLGGITGCGEGNGCYQNYLP